jgi:hypothetical protein
MVTAVNRGDIVRKLPLTGNWIDLLTRKMYYTQREGPVKIVQDGMMLLKRID